MMITAVVLTYNDENTLAETLNSLDWCNERIIIDDFSTDKSTPIAKRFGASVYERHLKENFAEQRNFGLTKAKGDWVLFVDSDEVIGEELAREIQNAIKNEEINGYFIKRKDFFGGRWLVHGETSRVRLLRLARRDAGMWERPVHEVWNVRGPVGELFTPIQHFPHQNVAQFLKEINGYSTINARYLYSQKVRVPWQHVIGYPVAKFFVNFIIYLGFLDGTSGIVVAFMMSFHSFLTRAKLWQLWDRGA